MAEQLPLKQLVERSIRSGVTNRSPIVKSGFSILEITSITGLFYFFIKSNIHTINGAIASAGRKFPLGLA